VSFKNAIIIMTSNVGSPVLIEGVNAAGEITADARRAVLDELKRSFRPEFLNRLDEVVLFRPLGMTQIEAIVRIQLDDLRARLAEQDLTLEADDQAVAWVAKNGFDPVYGARPIKRTIQREIETPVARRIVAGDFPSGATVHITATAGKLKVTAAQGASTGGT